MHSFGKPVMILVSSVLFIFEINSARATSFKSHDNTSLFQFMTENKLNLERAISQEQQDVMDLSLSQDGRGVYSINSRFRENITSVTVVVKPNGDAELIFRNNDQTLVRFKGEVTRRDPYAIKVKLTESDLLDATGQADIQYGSDTSSISSIFVAGTIDNQIFSISFNR